MYDGVPALFTQTDNSYFPDLNAGVSGNTYGVLASTATLYPLVNSFHVLPSKRNALYCTLPTNFYEVTVKVSVSPTTSGEWSTPT